MYLIIFNLFDLKIYACKMCKAQHIPKKMYTNLSKVWAMPETLRLVHKAQCIVIQHRLYFSVIGLKPQPLA